MHDPHTRGMKVMPIRKYNYNEVYTYLDTLNEVEIIFP
jgi:hypothetical protein